MSTIRSSPIEDNNLSRAWARVLVALAQPGVDEIVPLQVTINDFDPEISIEIPAIRRALDEDLKAKKLFSSETVASTIFNLDETITKE